MFAGGIVDYLAGHACRRALQINFFLGPRSLILLAAPRLQRRESVFAVSGIALHGPLGRQAVGQPSLPQ